MNYLKFMGWLLFLTWIVSDSVPRYLLPRLESCYDTLEELAAGGWGTGRWGAGLSLIIQIVFSAFFAYILSIWSVWCVLRCFIFTQGMDGRVIYFLSGFVCCEYALGKMARFGQYRGFFMSVFPYVMAMGTFIVFALNPLPIKETYPWLIEWMGAVL